MRLWIVKILGFENQRLFRLRRLRLNSFVIHGSLVKIVKLKVKSFRRKKKFRRKRNFRWIINFKLKLMKFNVMRVLKAVFRSAKYAIVADIYIYIHIYILGDLWVECPIRSMQLTKSSINVTKCTNSTKC